MGWIRGGLLQAGRAGGDRTGVGRSDSGAGTLEYIGILAIVASVIGSVAVAPIAEPIRVGVETAICRVLGGQDCGAGARADNALPKCETSFDSRTLGLTATVFSIKAGRSDEYRISRYGDGTAKVSTTDTGELGVSAGVGGSADLTIGDDGSLGGGAGAKASATVTGGLRAVYEFDSVEAADAWVEENRNGFTHTLNAAGGPLADGIEQVWNAFDDDRPEPTAVAVEMSARLRGSAEGGLGGLVQAGAEASGSVTGTYERSLRDGTSSFTSTLAGSAGAQATLLFGRGSVEGSSDLGYTVKYDAQGEPVSLTLTQTTASEAAVGMNTTPLGTGTDTIKDVGWNFNIAEMAGSQTTTTTLDLTVPANRAAFDEAFLRAGPVAAPDPAAVFDGSAEALGARNAADGIVVRTSYAVEKGGGGLDVGVGAGFKFAVGGSVATLNRQLLAATVFDARNPAAGAQPLTTCG